MKKWISKERERVLILLLAGVLLLAAAIPAEQKTVQETAAKMTEGTDDTVPGTKEEILEKKLEKILSSVKGIGEVQVMITLKSDGKKMVEKDKNSSSSGGSEDTFQNNLEENTVFQKDSSGNEIPYVSETAEPEVAGVLVAAQGADQGTVAVEIIEAVMALFGTDAHKIKVMKMK